MRAVVLSTLVLSSAFAQRPSQLSGFAGIKPGDTIVIGFLGGMERWDDPNRGVRKVALDLRQQDIPGVHADTIENRHRKLATQFIVQALDWNHNGVLDPEERAGTRIILYGQSLGGDAAIHVARDLNKMHVGVLLTVQVDSVGLHDGTIPPNVAAAANFYQHEPFTIQGRRTIQAEDPARTTILGSFQFRYHNKEVDESSATWVRRKLGGAHTKMELDPAVWQQVEQVVVDAITKP